jgi:hypothetical protein
MVQFHELNLLEKAAAFLIAAMAIGPLAALTLGN